MIRAGVDLHNLTLTDSIRANTVHANSIQDRALMDEQKFENMKPRDLVRLALVLIASVLLASIGVFAEASTGTSDNGAVTSKAKKNELKFTLQQIQRYETLSGDLHERAQNELDEANQIKMKVAIEKLDQRIDETRESLEQASQRGSCGKQKNAIACEHLRGSLNLLQEAGSRAVGVVIDVDNGLAQSPFKISASTRRDSDLTP